ncbi:MAG: MBL fold metallo-hydrolase [Vicinamibacterales bacterium]
MRTRTRSGWMAMVACAMTLAGACTRLTPEQQFVHDVATALGGVDRVQAARLVTLTGTGRQWNLGQDLRPGLAEQTFTVSAFTRVIDLQQPRLRTTTTRTPNFSFYQGPQAQTAVTGLDGDVAYAGATAERLTRASRTAAIDRRDERLHHPLVLVRAALAGATVSPVRTTGDERAVDVTIDGTPVTLVVDATHRPLRVTSAGAHPNLGDITLTTRFGNYATAGGFTLPGTIATQVDDFTTAEFIVTTTVANDGTTEAPDALRTAAEPTPTAPNVTSDEVAPGVWLLAGQSHNSALVAFKDRTVLIEAPQSEARTKAVLAKTRELAPKTPLTTLVMTHHHFDHSAGLRAALAEGLAIVTHEGNRDFVTAMAGRPFTRQPDALASVTAPAVDVQTVAASHTISDGTRSMVLYHLSGNPHSDTLLMAYLPKEKVLIEADAWSPEGGGYHPYAANLLDHIRRLKLDVARIVPLHGAPATLKELEAVVQAQAAPTK